MKKSKYWIFVFLPLLLIYFSLSAQQSTKKKPSVKKNISVAGKVVKPPANNMNKSKPKPAVSKSKVPKSHTGIAKKNNKAVKKWTLNPSKQSKPQQTSSPKKNVTSPFEKQKGKLSIPVSSAKIIRSFGKCAHPTLSGVYVDNLGIDLRAKSQMPVRSVFSGIITEVFSIPGVGGTVIVKHGDYYTVYSGIDISSAEKEKNNKINKGQILGNTYKTVSGTSDFSFQIWRGRQKLNPKDWILPLN